MSVICITILLLWHWLLGYNLVQLTMYLSVMVVTPHMHAQAGGYVIGAGVH